MVMNKYARIGLKCLAAFSVVALLLSMYFVFASIDVVSVTSNNVNEDIGFIYNITINNTDSGISGNITGVNITLPNGFLYIPGEENGTGASGVFSNTSSVLSWTNATYLINITTNNTNFWFNATAATPGFYNITVEAVNVTGSYFTNISVEINDTTVPVPSIVYPVANTNYFVNVSELNYTVTDNGVLGSCWYSANGGATNSTSVNGGANFTGNVTTAENSNTLTLYCNDSAGNENSASVSFNQYTTSFEFNGTVYNVDSTALNNSLINISVRDTSFNLIGSSSVYSNESGWFNLSVVGPVNAFYQPVITYTNASESYVQYIGQSLPAFPSTMLVRIAGTSFYLREAGTINITAINSTGDRIGFKYQIKDTKLGYPISENFNSNVNESIISVPKDRNYSIMIYPVQSMPVSFDWNNFSSSSSYNFSSGLSSYNATINTLQKQFNTTMGAVRVYGYIINSTNGTAYGSWDEFTVVPYLLEPGSMVHLTYGDMPYNLSAFLDPTNGDYYNLTSGFYNISLPSTAESSEVILFATARNGTSFMGGVRNGSFSYSPIVPNIEMNITIYELLGIPANISMDTTSGGQINISTAKQTFTFVNSSNTTLSGVSGHIEVTVDYSSIGAKEFTWMADVSQSGSAVINLPLINATGIKELNAFVGGGNYAPVRKSYTLSQIQSAQNITVGTFNPGDIDDPTAKSGIMIEFYKSNSTCDVPGPAASCAIGAGGGAGEGFSSFNPMKAIMGGGKLSFRMGLFSTGIVVHYVNVDMLASGPPDALFDNSENRGKTSGSFESAFRFGSGGPTIYDFVLISMPYTQGSSSTTGLDENSDINISIPLFYDESWNIIWNVSSNGTNASALAGNDSHYSSRQAEWQYLMSSMNCTKTVTEFNSSRPCYVNKSNDRIWVRLPHFSGTDSQITGNVITADNGGGGTTGSSGGGSSTTTSFWTGTFIPSDVQINEGYTKELAVKKRVKVNMSGEIHYVGVVNITDTTATINVSSNPQQKVMNVGEEWKVEITGDNFYDLLLKLNGIVNSKANLSIQGINEEVPAGAIDGDESGDIDAGGEDGIAGDAGEELSDGQSSGFWIWAIIIILILIGVVVYIISFKNKN